MTGNMDDDDDFGYFAGGASRLSSLFPSQAPNGEDVNQSLMYVAPKQPKKNEDQSSLSLRNFSLLHVVSAYTYKLDQGQYANQGKLGAAILGDIDNFAYKLLLYTGKKQQVALSTINPDFAFMVEPNWYAKFTDDKGGSWSIKFGSEEMLVDFAKQVALAKANTFGKMPMKLVIQDLVAGEGGCVESDDSVSISYAAWFFKNHGFGELFEDNKRSEKPLIIKLSKRNAIKGLCEGLLGAKKNMKRLLIVPPSHAYGSEGLPNVVPSNQTLIYELTIKKIRPSRDISSSPSHGKKDSDVKPDVPPRTQSISDDSIRSRGASISEQLTQSPRKDNAKLISRMAKMGMPTLPLQGAIVAQTTSSESEAEKEVEIDRRNAETDRHSVETDRHSTETGRRITETGQHSTETDRHIAEIDRHSTSPKPFAVTAVQSEPIRHEVHHAPRKSISSPRTSSPLVQTPVPQHSSTVVYPAFANAPVHGDAMAFMAPPLMPHPTSFMAPLVPGLMESHLPLLVTETRTQSTEIRMMLGKISDKLDSVMPKLEEIKSQHGSASVKQESPYMESSVLSQNIERIIQENVQLKKENETKSSKIQELNEKICDILQRNQGFFEESNSILEQRSDSLQMTTSQLQSKVLSLEQEKVKLSSSLTETTTNLHQMQMECNEKERLNTDLSHRLEASENKIRDLQMMIDDLRVSNAEKDNFHQTHSGDLEEWKSKTQDLKVQLGEMEKKLEDEAVKKEGLMAKLSEMTNDHTLEVEKLKQQIQAEGEKYLQCKKKYDSLLENTRALKDRYDSQMESLLAELKQSRMQAKSREPSNDFSVEIKKAMNMLYKVLQSEVKESQSYSSAEVLQLTLEVIWRVTMQFIDKGLQQVENSSNNSSRSNSIGRSSPKDDADVNCDKVIPATECVESDKDSSSEPEKIFISAPSAETKEESDSPPKQAVESNVKVQSHDEQSQSPPPTEEVEAKQEGLQKQPITNVEPPTDESATEKESNEQNSEKETKSLSDPAPKEPTSKPTLVPQSVDDRKSPEIWRPQPPTPPLFDEESEDEDDWLK